MKRLIDIDAVVVVRCKNCKHFRTDYQGGYCVCEFGLSEPKEQDFCSYGVEV